MNDWLMPSAEMVEVIHDAVLNPGELPGLALDKSLDSAVAQVENRVAYGMIGDLFDLAAGYAMMIARGHFFDDANKRAAYRVMQVVLDMNGAAEPDMPEDALGQQIIALAQGLIDDGDLAEWLRALA